MQSNFSRRDFMAFSAAGAAGLMMTGRLQAAAFKTTIHKAMIGEPTEANLTAWKAVGFEGMESTLWDVTPQQAEASRKLADKAGMKIHSVMRGWARFNNPDASALPKSIASVETALRAAAAYGATTILLVPASLRELKKLAVPQHWEFDIEFDEKTGHLTRAVAGDNAKYREYIELHNQAIDISRQAIEKLLPVAEKLGVIIAVENVGNHLWVMPKLFANFVQSFNSPWLRAYFDIANHVPFAPPEVWIRTLGKLIVKCHVKEFKFNPDGHNGAMVPLRSGSMHWPVIRQALDDIGYNGWASIEDGGWPDAELSKRFDLILAGK